MLKRRIGILCLAVAAVGLAFAGWMKRPVIAVPYRVSENGIASEADVSLTRVLYCGEDVTERMDEAALIHCLSQCAYRLVDFRLPGNYLLEDYPWEIGLNQGGKPIHLAVGSQAFWYSKNSARFRICNASTLADELAALLAG